MTEPNEESLYDQPASDPHQTNTSRRQVLIIAFFAAFISFIFLAVWVYSEFSNTSRPSYAQVRTKPESVLLSQHHTARNFLSVLSRNKIAFGFGLILFATILVAAVASLVFVLAGSQNTTPADAEVVVHSVVAEDENSYLVPILSAIFLFGAGIVGLWYMYFKNHETRLFQNY